ncbi:MAG: hypothetical protein GY751_22415 [Bacteroidetes bacterium]|nr:hypothetical protein [Bacteroidota bacterium]
MSERNKRFLVVSVIILIAVISRLLPHPANATPVAAIALFGGAYFLDKKWAFILPVFALFISDLILQIMFWTGAAQFPGFYPDMVFVYASFMIVVGLGMGLKNRVNPVSVAGTAIFASVLFFLITNLGVWLTMNMYPKNLAGLMECYVAAIPFFRNTLIGDVVYSAIIFGAFESVLAARPQWKTASVKLR